MDSTLRFQASFHFGNTTASNGLGYVYDLENHVIQAGSGITMLYDVLRAKTSRSYSLISFTGFP